MDEIIQDFIVEATESLESLDHKFVELEKNPEATGLLNDIFRSVHTIKGAAGFLSFHQIVEVTHVTEEILNKLRKGEMVVTADIMDAVLEAVDLVKILIRNIKEKNNRKEETGPTIALLHEILKAHMPGAQAGAAVKEQAQTAGYSDAAPVDRPAIGRRAEDKDKEHNIRVDIDRLDAVMNLIGELVLSRNRLMVLGSKMSGWKADDDMVTQMDEGIGQLDLVTTDLQVAVMKMRMQPIAKVFNRFPRMVRDMARQNSKEIELLMTGEETELDKTVIEEIGDPLVHLIRNSIDHGIEAPEERIKRGKPACGAIKLKAYQEGQHIVVSVEDDGKGIDPQAITRSALEKGLITAEDSAKMSVKDSLNLIFIPGFSTAKNVSNISGRGVGMDVVKTNISKINGTINVESEHGKGTRITFRLPLTLAIIQVLTIQAGAEIYGIPLSTVVENIRVTGEEIKTIEGREVISIRDRVFPVIRLAGLVDRGGAAARHADGWKYIVIIGVGEKNLGLLVDRLHGQEEIVMKSMGEYLKGTHGVAGACINGDGNIILILDVADLMETSGKVVSARA
ncbi:MAG: chemotaxis protein CheA [Deltaproteobacteria bacterium]|nr:chemotaxis protein CheA [Deltaproteobacteria bacterium]